MTTTPAPAGAGPATPRSERSVLLGLPVLVAALTVTVALWADANDEPIGRFTRDPNQYYRGGTWTGLLSTLGNSLWVVAATAALLGAMVAHLRGVDRKGFVALGCLSALLHVDDTYLFHDVVLPELGVPEKAVSLAWAAFAGVAVLLALPMLREHRLLPSIGVAAVGFAVSVLADALDVRTWGENWLFGIEDGAKLVGIAAWTSALVVATRRTIRATG